MTSLATAITISVANIFDSHILSKKLTSLSPYFLTMAVFQILTALIALAIFPFPAAPRWADIMAGIGGGMANAVALVILLNALQKGEVSRVIPVTSSFPIFVALLSMPLLGEVISLTGWLAVLLTVAGAVLISLQIGGSGQKTKLHKSFLLLLFVALLFSVSNIAYKYAMNTISIWNTFTINGICIGVVALIFSIRKKKSAGTQKPGTAQPENRVDNRQPINSSAGHNVIVHRHPQRSGGPGFNNHEYPAGVYFDFLVDHQPLLPGFYHRAYDEKNNTD